MDDERDVCVRCVLFSVVCVMVEERRCGGDGRRVLVRGCWRCDRVRVLTQETLPLSPPVVSWHPSFTQAPNHSWLCGASTSVCQFLRLWAGPHSLRRKGGGVEWKVCDFHSLPHSPLTQKRGSRNVKPSLSGVGSVGVGESGVATAHHCVPRFPRESCFPRVPCVLTYVYH